MIYLNYNSTAPLCCSAKLAIEPFVEQFVGNPSELLLDSGKAANDAVQQARVEVAELVRADAQEVVFTSGGSEAAFLALAGVVAAGAKNLVISTIEHPAVVEAAMWLARTTGVTVQQLPISAERGIDWDQCDKLFKSSAPGIASFMFANNETGDLLPIEELSLLAKSYGWLIHSDSVQAAGKTELDFNKTGIDLLSISSHKLSGPRGVGALVIKEGTAFDSPHRAGGQEEGRRGGTHNVAGIIGFGAAAKEAGRRLESGAAQTVSQLRDRFENKLKSLVDRAEINRVATFERLCNTASIYLPATTSFRLVQRLEQRGVVVSAGSACASSQLKPSRTLLALGFSSTRALSTLRVSLGYETTESEVERAVEIIAEEAEAMRNETEKDLAQRMANV